MPASDPSGRSGLRYGWTTGACAAAATKAAYTALLTGEFPDPVQIALPRGQTPSFALTRERLVIDEASASITKDAGDVMDADGVEIGLVFDAEHVHVVRPGEPLTPEAIARFEVHDLDGPSPMVRAARTGERQFVEADGVRSGPTPIARGAATRTTP